MPSETNARGELRAPSVRGKGGFEPGVAELRLHVSWERAGRRPQIELTGLALFPGDQNVALALR